METLTSMIPEWFWPFVGICMLGTSVPGLPIHLILTCLDHTESTDSQIKTVLGYKQQKPILADLSREGSHLLERIG